MIYLFYLFKYYFFRSERDVNNVEITHQETKTKTDKVSYHLYKVLPSIYGVTICI